MSLNSVKVQQLIELLDKKKFGEVRKVLVASLPKKKKVKYSVTLDLEKVKDIASHFRTKLVQNQTESETKFKALLKAASLEYSFQHVFYYPRKNGGKGFYIVDFYLPEKNIVIEIDGGYHNSTEQKQRDKDRSKALKAEGILEVLRYTNEEVTSKTEEIINKLSTLVTINTLKRKTKTSLDGVELQVINGRKYKKRNEEIN